VAAAAPSSSSPVVLTQPRTPRRRFKPSAKEIEKANALRAIACPWEVAKRWPGLPVADPLELARRLGEKLTPTAQLLLAVVRKVVRCGFPGVQVSGAQLADHFGVSERHAFRALAQLRRLRLVRSVHGYVRVGCELDRRAIRDAHGRRTGQRALQRYRNRQVASVLVLDEMARRPLSRPRLLARADREVIPKRGEREPTVLSLPTASAESAAAPRFGGQPSGSLSAGLTAGSRAAPPAPGGDVMAAHDAEEAPEHERLGEARAEWLAAVRAGDAQRAREIVSDPGEGVDRPPAADAADRSARDRAAYDAELVRRLDRGPDPAGPADAAAALAAFTPDASRAPARDRSTVDWAAAEAAIAAAVELARPTPTPAAPAERDANVSGHVAPAERDASAPGGDA
jgi:hypothetical protein